MKNPEGNITCNRVSRRKAIAQIFFGSLGVVASFPILSFRMPELSQKPDERQILSAFMETIVPGLDITHTQLTNVFFDPYYRFTKFRRTLVNDLVKRTKRLFQVNNFTALPLQKREKVVKHALHAGIIKKKIYTAAIYLAQITVYTGIYNDKCSCPIIDFEAEYNFEPTTYKNPMEFLGTALTTDGNYI